MIVSNQHHQQLEIIEQDTVNERESKPGRRVRQKDMGPYNPEYHWDYLEALYYCGDNE